MPLGGYQRDPRVPQLGPFIRDSLAGGRISWAQQLYTEYKTAVQAIPLKAGGGLRKVISKDNFRIYLSVMRNLGLVEFVIDPDTGDVDGAMAQDKGGNPAPHLAPSKYLRMVPGAQGSPDWNNIWKA